MNKPTFANYIENGWCRFAFDPALNDWVNNTLPCARKAVDDPENAEWFRYQNTWFVGVNVLDNDATGRVPGGLPLSGNAVNFILDHFGNNEIIVDRAQVSVCYPGYPQRADDEPESAHGFRLRRYAAHVDGLLRERPGKNRYLRERHAYILGIAMTSSSDDAAPFVIWRGSHHLVKEAFSTHFGDTDPAQWEHIDVAEMYQSVRRRIFAECERVEIPLKPGEAIVAHRHVLHGTAPWGEDATAADDGRMICFFRPPTLTPAEWLGNL